MKNKSADFDLALDMSRNLQEQKVESVLHINKIAAALDCLNKAAELLDNMNAHQASEIVTKIIQKVAYNGFKE